MVASPISEETACFRDACPRDIELSKPASASFKQGERKEIPLTVKNTGTCTLQDVFLSFISPGWQFEKKAAGELSAGSSKEIKVAITAPSDYSGTTSIFAVAEAAGIYQLKEFEATVLKAETGAKEPIQEAKPAEQGQANKTGINAQETPANQIGQTQSNATNQTTPKIRVKIFEDVSSAIQSITNPLEGITEDVGDKNAMKYATPALLAAGVASIIAVLAIAGLIYSFRKKRK